MFQTHKAIIPCFVQKWSQLFSFTQGFPKQLLESPEEGKSAIGDPDIVWYTEETRPPFNKERIHT
jgi:hypothetical protein